MLCDTASTEQLIHVELRQELPAETVACTRVERRDEVPYIFVLIMALMLSVCYVGQVTSTA